MLDSYSRNGSDPYNSPYTYQSGSPFHIPAYNSHQHPAPLDTHANYIYDEAASHKYGNDGVYPRNERQPDQDWELDLWDQPQPTLYSKDQAWCAAEYGLTPQELQELSQDCIREQEELEQEYQREIIGDEEACRWQCTPSLPGSCCLHDKNPADRGTAHGSTWAPNERQTTRLSPLWAGAQPPLPTTQVAAAQTCRTGARPAPGPPHCLPDPPSLPPPDSDFTPSATY